MSQFPAIRFLDRGQQLMRLQARVAKRMLADIEAEQSAFEQRAPVTGPADIPAFQREVIANVARSRERLADIQLMFQMFYCRHVDNFQIFLEELVRDIASATPTLLESVKLKNPDRYDTAERRERRLQAISRMNLRELRDLLDQAISFSLVTTSERGATLDRLFDIRNLLIHNNGVVDFMFAKRYPSEKPIGQQFELDRPFIEGSFHELLNASNDIQTRAQERFNLWRTPPV